MWNDTLQRLHRLKELDRQRQAFGADHHRYFLKSCLSEDDLAKAEERLGVALPEQLREFYTTVGNGEAGPHYGLRPAGRLFPMRPTQPYPGAEHYRELSKRLGYQSRDGEDYFEVPHDEITGLAGIIGLGCGHEICIVTAGPLTGKIVEVSNDGYVIDAFDSLVDCYEDWLDEQLGTFEMVAELMASNVSLAQMYSQVRQKYRQANVYDVIVSIADVKKPESLFGRPGQIRIHGASQKPWYAKVLSNWRAKR